MMETASVNSSVISNLKRIINSGRIPHSFLIEGSTFEERMKTAIYLAKGVLCSGDNKPCNNCNQCKTADSSSNADISLLRPEKDKKFISVEQIRNLRQEAYIMPHSAQRRVFIIENAELMNEQGQNALLKILEEPPKTVVFILLVSSRTLLLPTVISRCSIFLLSTEEISDKKIITDAENILSLLFEAKEYDILLMTKSYEKDRIKSEKLLNSIKDLCVNNLKSGNISMYRSLVYSKIFDQIGEYIESINTNVNMSLLFSAMISKFKSFI